jgi:hypothetical protein
MHGAYHTLKSRTLDARAQLGLDVFRHAQNPIDSVQVPDGDIQIPPVGIVHGDNVSQPRRKEGKTRLDSGHVIRNDGVLRIPPQPFQKALRRIRLKPGRDETHGGVSFRACARSFVQRQHRAFTSNVLCNRLGRVAAGGPDSTRAEGGNHPSHTQIRHWSTAAHFTCALLWDARSGADAAGGGVAA